MYARCDRCGKQPNTLLNKTLPPPPFSSTTLSLSLSSVLCPCPSVLLPSSPLPLTTCLLSVLRLATLFLTIPLRSDLPTRRALFPSAFFFKPRCTLHLHPSPFTCSPSSLSPTPHRPDYSQSSSVPTPTPTTSKRPLLLRTLSLSNRTRSTL